MSKIGHRHTTIAWYAVLAVPLLVPPAVSNLTGLGFRASFTASPTTTPKFLVLGLAMATALGFWGYSVWRGDTKLQAPARWWIPAAVAVTAVISSAAGIHPASAVLGSESYRQGLITQLLLLSLFFLTVQLASMSRIRQLALATTAGSLIVAAYAALQVAGFDPNRWANVPLNYIERGFGMLGNPDMLGGYLLFGTLVSLSMAIAEGDSRRSWAWWIASSALASMIALTQTRSAWIGLAVGLAAFATAAWLGRFRPSRLDVAVYLSVPLAAFVTGYLRNVAKQGIIVRRIVEAVTQPAAAGTGRLDFWREALAVISERPLLGTGPDSYLLGWFQHQTPASLQWSGSKLLVADPHNTVLMLAATVGVPAALLVLAWIGSSFYDAAATLRTPLKRDPRSMLPYAGWTAALVAFATYSMLGIVTLSGASLVALSLAVLSAPAANPIEVQPAARKAVAFGAFVVAGVAIVSAASLGIADNLLIRGLSASDPRTGLVLIERAARLIPYDYTYRAQAAKTKGIIALATIRSGLPAEQAVTDALDAYAMLTRDFPAHYDGHLSRAALLLDLSRQHDPALAQQAADVAKQAIAVRPAGVDARTIAAQAYASLGRHKDAADVLEDWWDADPTTPEPGLQYAAALLNLGRASDGIAVLDELARRFPQDQTVRSLREAAASDAEGEAP